MTPVFCCGFECGQIGSVGQHWLNNTGTAAISTTTVRSGARSLRINPAAAGMRVYNTALASSSIWVVRFYVRFATLPGADYVIFNTVGLNHSVIFRQSDSKIYLRDSNNNLGASGHTITTNTWYRVDVQFDTTSSVVGSIYVDGTSYGGVSTGTAGAYTQIAFGHPTSATCDMFIDDVIISHTAADFPIGAGRVDHFVPTADGTHNIAGTADFQRTLTGTDILNATTTAFQLVDDVPLESGAGTDWINMIAPPNATDYVECVFGPAPGISTPVAAPRAVEIIAGIHHAGTGTGNMEIRINDNGTTNAMYSATAVAGVTSIIYKRKHYATPPAAGAWTVVSGAGNFNNLRVRFGSPATLDVNPDQYFDGIMVEAEFGDAGAIVGSTAGVGSQSGALIGNGALAASNAGTASQAGTLIGIAPIVASTAGVASQAGTAVAIGALVGSTAGVASQSGAIEGSGALAGTIPGVASQSGVLVGSGSLAGSTAGVATDNATLLGIVAAVGSTSGIATDNVTLVGIGSLVALVAGTVSLNGTLVGSGAMVGSAAGIAADSAVISGSGALSANENGLASLVGSLVGIGALVGSTAGTCVVDGVISSQNGTNGIAIGNSDAVGTLSGIGALAGTISGNGNAAGSINAIVPITGSVAGQTTINATLNGNGALVGTGSGVNILSGNILGIAAISGTAQGQAEATGNIQEAGAGETGGNVAGSSSLSGSLVGIGSIYGSVSGVAIDAAILVGAGALAGSVGGSCAVNGTFYIDGAMIGSCAGTSFCIIYRLEYVNLQAKVANGIRKKSRVISVGGGSKVGNAIKRSASIKKNINK